MLLTMNELADFLKMPWKRRVVVIRSRSRRSTGRMQQIQGLVLVEKETRMTPEAGGLSRYFPVACPTKSTLKVVLTLRANVCVKLENERVS